VVSPLFIRPAVVSERSALEALQSRASLNNLGDRPALLANPEVNQIPKEQLEAGQVFVAEQSGSVVGFAVIVPRSDGNVELDGLFVEPDKWRRGIGRQLVDHCAQLARLGGSTALHVVGNPHAEGFYSRCGFTRIGTVDLRFGIGLLFRKLL
jgi:N-acetylglutamate synthase-like GNAT family acetyltransferase